MSALKAYHSELLDIYSFYIEVYVALLMWNTRLTELVDGSNATTGRSTMYFGKGDPNDPATKAHHARTFEYLIEASARDSSYARQLRWSAIVRLYSIWEDRFRQQIADECGLARNDIRGEAHGDLRVFRHSIIHAGGRLDQEPRVLRFFKKGDMLDFSESQMIDLFWHLTAEMNGIGVRHYGTDLGLTLTVA